MLIRPTVGKPVATGTPHVHNEDVDASYGWDPCAAERGVYDRGYGLWLYYGEIPPRPQPYYWIVLHRTIPTRTLAVQPAQM